MNKKIIIPVLVLLLKYSYSQTNLVPNPSFESYTTCPNTNDIGFATGWLNFGQTPDYFNGCANISTPGLGVPSNYVGFQNAKNGNGYAGIITYYQGGFREYIGIALTQTLTVGTKYYVSAYISRADSSPQLCSSNKFGFRFSKNVFDAFMPPPFNYSHIHSNTIITDSLGWTKISGSFIADSAYKYFIIGNFYDDANTSTSQCNFQLAYYYVDETCVSTDSTFCNISTGIKTDRTKPNIEIYPNPLQNTLNIKIQTNYSGSKITIYDVNGNTVLSQKLNSINNEIDISGCSEGLLFLKIIHNNQLYNYKLIKQKP